MVTEEAGGNETQSSAIEIRESANPGVIALHMAVNLVVGLPFFVVGIYGLTNPDLSRLAYFFTSAIAIGTLLVLVGIYLSVLSRPKLNLVWGEKLMILRHPSLKPAFAQIIMSIPLFLLAGGLLALTEYPYVFPFVPFMVAVFLYFQGVVRYWINNHTTYYVTDRRAAQVYQFVSLDIKEIPIDSINSISETRSFIEMITGRGSVVAASGVSESHKVRMREIDNPDQVAHVLRGTMST